MGLDATLRHKASLPTADGTPRFFGILNGLDTELLGPGHRHGPRGPLLGAADLAGKAACRADLLARHGMDPADPAPVLGMIGRLDPQKGFDLLADAAPELVELGARIIVQGSGDPRLADPFRRAGDGQPGPGRARRAVRPGERPADLRGLGPVPDAVPVRAVRAGPDDRDALRHAAARPPDRRPRRHRDRRDRAAGGGDRVRRSTSRRRPRCRRPADGRSPRAAATARRPPGPGSSSAGWRSTSAGRRAPRPATPSPTGGPPGCAGRPWRPCSNQRSSAERDEPVEIGGGDDGPERDDQGRVAGAGTSSSARPG